MGGLNPLVGTDMPDFPGLQTNADPRDIAPGASVQQVNILCIGKGRLQGRLGIRPGTFANGITPVGLPVYSMVHYSAPNEEWIVFEQTDGKIRVGNNFA